jgi:hypothetical protein
MRFICFIFFCLATGLASASATTAVAPKGHAVLTVDSASAVNVRHFDANTLKSYARQPEFKYDESKVDLSWWERFWHWFWDWFIDLFKFKKLPGNLFLSILTILWRIIEILTLLGAIVAIIYVILKWSGVDVRNVFRRQPAVAISHSEFVENINTINFDAEIENAVAAHNYRFAVRLLYLKCLKQLSDSSLIEWKIDKTNYAYLNELKNEGQRAAFGSLTRKFEYVWYGEFLIDASLYGDISSSFSNFNKQVP